MAYTMNIELEGALNWCMKCAHPNKPRKTIFYVPVGRSGKILGKLYLMMERAGITARFNKGSEKLIPSIAHLFSDVENID